MIKITCKYCKSELSATEGQKSVFCSYCGGRNEIVQPGAPNANATVNAKPYTSTQKYSAAPAVSGADAPYIFISYAHKDSDRVLPVIKGLKARGFNVWYDAGIEAGTEWPDYIAEKLLGCGCFIAFLSQASIDSRNCRQEIEFAISENKDMLTVYLDDVKLPAGLRMRLGLIQAMYKSRFGSDSEFLTELAGARILKGCK